MGVQYVMRGWITPEGGIELEERLPLPPGPVGITIESPAEPDGAVEPHAPGPRLFVSDAEARRQKEGMRRLIGCLSNEEAEEMLQIIEDEFGGQAS